MTAAENFFAQDARRLVRAWAFVALSASSLVAHTSAGTVDNFTTSNLESSNYSAGTPTNGTANNNGSDVITTTTTSTSLTISGNATVNMESLTDPGTEVGTITNATASTVSTLSLGNSFGFTNANNTSAAVPDLIYVEGGGTKNLTIGGGAGTLNIVLASSGNIDDAATGSGSAGVTLTISSNISDGGNGYGLNITGTAPDPVVFTGTNTYSGGTKISAGELDVSGDASLGAVPTTKTAGITVNGGELSSVSGDSFTINANRTILLGSATGTLIGVKGASGIVTYNGSFQDLTTGGVLTKQGAGTLVLGGVSTFTGPTTINTGTIQLNTANALSTTSGITVNTATTLALTASNALATPGASTGVGLTGPGTTSTAQVSLTLSGGTLQRNGSGISLGSQSGSTGTVGLGTLMLTAASTINYGPTGVGTLNFNGLAGVSATNTLAITNYTTTELPATAGVDGTDDRLIFNQNLSLSGELPYITIDGGATAEVLLGNGEYEVIEVVPEPSTWVAVLFGLGVWGLHLYFRRKPLS